MGELPFCCSRYSVVQDFFTIVFKELRTGTAYCLYTFHIWNRNVLAINATIIHEWHCTGTINSHRDPQHFLDWLLNPWLWLVLLAAATSMRCRTASGMSAAASSRLPHRTIHSGRSLPLRENSTRLQARRELCCSLNGPPVGQSRGAINSKLWHGLKVSALGI